mmetsp:Transcript_104757/g.303175  ORF Transcript_104757/g.303175 Transcript_104757/m.303175 type:complete len:334 (+) Transcript_104757:2-1003(+)
MPPAWHAPAAAAMSCAKSVVKDTTEIIVEQLRAARRHGLGLDVAGVQLHRPEAQFQVVEERVQRDVQLDGRVRGQSDVIVERLRSEGELPERPIFHSLEVVTLLAVYLREVGSPLRHPLVEEVGGPLLLFQAEADHGQVLVPDVLGDAPSIVRRYFALLEEGLQAHFPAQHSGAVVNADWPELLAQHEWLARVARDFKAHPLLRRGVPSEVQPRQLEVARLPWPVEAQKGAHVVEDHLGALRQLQAGKVVHHELGIPTPAGTAQARKTDLPEHALVILEQAVRERPSGLATGVRDLLHAIVVMDTHVLKERADQGILVHALGVGPGAQNICVG